MVGALLYHTRAQYVVEHIGKKNAGMIRRTRIYVLRIGCQVQLSYLGKVFMPVGRAILKEEVTMMTNQLGVVAAVVVGVVTLSCALSARVHIRQKNAGTIRRTRSFVLLRIGVLRRR
jgi:hypothetical protein